MLVRRRLVYRLKDTHSTLDDLLGLFISSPRSERLLKRTRTPSSTDADRQRQPVSMRYQRGLQRASNKGATTGRSEGSGPPPPKFGRITPTFYVAADCSARGWVYHPYFVLYNNLDHGTGSPNFENVVAPLASNMQWPNTVHILCFSTVQRHRRSDIL